MSLLDTTYFTKEIHIPTSKYTTLQSVIDRYEPKMIRDLFGYELALLIKAYDAGTSPQRIKDIVEGKVYTPSYGASMGHYTASGTPKIKWNGLLNDDKVSLLAYWVFYWYMRENETFLSISGSGKSKSENAYDAGDNPKSVFAWNRMFELYGGFTRESSINPSCFNFMKEFESSYPEWVFTYKRNINRFGL